MNFNFFGFFPTEIGFGFHYQQNLSEESSGLFYWLFAEKLQILVKKCTVFNEKVGNFVKK